MGAFDTPKLREYLEEFDTVAKKVAAAAQVIIDSKDAVKGHIIEDMMKIAEKDAQQVKEAMTCLDGEQERAKALLWASYFVMKYELECTRADVLAEDEEMLREYESYFVEHMPEAFGEETDREVLTKLQQAIREHQLTQELLEAVRGKLLIEEKQNFLCGLPYLNWNLSETLQNVVKVFTAANWENTLAVASSVGSYIDKAPKFQNVDYDEVFGIAPENYVMYIALRKNWYYENCRQFQRHRELFLETMNKVPKMNAIKMLSCIKNLDRPLYDKIREEQAASKKKADKKTTNFDWAYETPFSPVHKKDGSCVEDAYMQEIMGYYAMMTQPGANHEAMKLLAELDVEDVACFANELYDKWMGINAEAKKRWVLYFAAAFGGITIIDKIKPQIGIWVDDARGAIAAEAVRSLALNPVEEAIVFVDELARKAKHKQVKNAANGAVAFAAEQLGISKEELEDKIVPDLDFDEHAERMFDYGTRQFKVVLTTALEMVVYDENDKKIKTLPAPGKMDDEEKATSASAEFKQLKKQLKAMISSQKLRLESALSTERTWKTDAWKKLFVKNPIMHQFAIGLVWGIYENKKLVQSFRYMGDGSFNTVEEKELILEDNQTIGLVHPVELSAEEIDAWKQQMEDYEITQPIEQLDRMVFTVSKEERQVKSVECFGGRKLYAISLNSKMLELGWSRGAVQDAGSFFSYYREDADRGYGVELHFSGCCVDTSYDNDSVVTVYEARFYTIGASKRQNDGYAEIKDENALVLKDIPQRYYSEIMLQLSKATASSQETDKDWKLKVS